MAAVTKQLERGANVNAWPSGFDNIGGTLLHFAAGGPNPRIIELLASLGADLTAKDFKYGSTPLGWAEYMKNEEHILLLKKHGAT